MRLPPLGSGVAIDLIRQLACVSEERKAFVVMLREIMSLYACDAGAVYIHQRSKARLNRVTSVGEACWDADTVARFFRNEKPALSPDVIMAPVRSGSQVIGVLALAKQQGFERGAGRIATELLRVAGGVLSFRREIAVAEAVAGVAAAAFRGVAPKDIVYRAFHQLRRFITYDHGATLVGRIDSATAAILARQVAWTKGRSDIVGMQFSLAWDAMPGDGPPAATGSLPDDIQGSLGCLRETGSPEKQSGLVMTLAAEHDVVGLVEVASTIPSFFLDTDTTILARFRPVLAWCSDWVLKRQGGHTA